MRETAPRETDARNVGLAYFFWALIHTMEGSFDGGVISFPVAVAASIYGAGLFVMCCAFNVKLYRTLVFCGYGAVLLNYGIIGLILQTDDGWTMLIYLMVGMVFWLVALVAAFAISMQSAEQEPGYAKIPGVDSVV